MLHKNIFNSHPITKPNPSTMQMMLVLVGAEGMPDTLRNTSHPCDTMSAADADFDHFQHVKRHTLPPL